MKNSFEIKFFWGELHVYLGKGMRDINLSTLLMCRFKNFVVLLQQLIFKNMLTLTLLLIFELFLGLNCILNILNFIA
jgi:hypothetical protein